jgi:hypothetical protein
MWTTILQVLILPLLRELGVWLIGKVLNPESEVKSYEGQVPAVPEIDNPVDAIINRYDVVCN